MTRTLEPIEYWKLRALCSDTQRCEVLARQARETLTTAHGKQSRGIDRPRARSRPPDVHPR